MPFGAHVSISGGISRAFARGEQVGCETMQIFSKNQRQWKALPYSPDEVAAYQAEQERTGIRPVVVHDTYLINLASPDDALWEKSIAAFANELERCATLGVPYLVMHPGAHTGSGEEAGLHRVAAAFQRLFKEGVGAGVMVLMETTAGQGTVLGSCFEHLARLMELAVHPERLGVCMDTCHIFAAGYDIRTPETYAATFEAFDRIVGLEHLKVLHLNDSQHDLGSRLDRHDHIGQGYLGPDAFRLLVHDARLRHLPMIIETPKGKDMAEDRVNLSLLRSL
ncbi:MAG: deoxyribonuclease IV [Chloroflexaceae bacterium]|nr:deoxyribonuclease IV [Chloroflexaceae bacterium]